MDELLWAEQQVYQEALQAFIRCWPSRFTYMGAADTFQQQSGDLCLPVKLTLGHPELLLRLRKKTKRTFIKNKLTKHTNTSGEMRMIKPTPLFMLACNWSRPVGDFSRSRPEKSGPTQQRSRTQTCNYTQCRALRDDWYGGMTWKITTETFLYCGRRTMACWVL